AGRLLELTAEVTRRCLFAHDRFHPSPLGFVGELHGEWMEVDVSEGAVLGAQPAADAPVLDHDLERVPPADGADGTTDHAQRIATRPARGRDQVLVEPEAVADEPGDPVMSLRARADTQIAPSAALQVEEQEVLGLHEPLRDEIVERYRADAFLARPV